jgi:hypothetical protein
LIICRGSRGETRALAPLLISLQDVTYAGSEPAKCDERNNKAGDEFIYLHDVGD